MFASLSTSVSTTTSTYITAVTDMVATNTVTQAMGYVLLVCTTFLVSIAIFKAGVVVLDTIMPAPANSHAGGTHTAGDTGATTNLNRALISAATALLIGVMIAVPVLVVASTLG